MELAWDDPVEKIISNDTWKVMTLVMNRTEEPNAQTKLPTKVLADYVQRSAYATASTKTGAGSVQFVREKWTGVKEETKKIIVEKYKTEMARLNDEKAAKEAEEARKRLGKRAGAGAAAAAAAAGGGGGGGGVDSENAKQANTTKHDLVRLLHVINDPANAVAMSNAHAVLDREQLDDKEKRQEGWQALCDSYNDVGKID